MFTLFKEIGIRRCISEELPYLVIAFMTAEILYKFHSFALECGAFLATWALLSGVGSFLTAVFRRKRVPA